MQIDYFTFAAQIINFLVLVFLLRHFLYRPVIRSMKEREQKISDQLKDAEEKRIQADQLAEASARARQEISDQRQELLARAAEDAKNLKNDLMKRAGSEVEAAKEGWLRSLQEQKEVLLADLSLRAGEEVYAVARHVLSDLADADLEGKVIDRYLQRLQNLEEREWEALKEFFESSREPVKVKSSFEIPADQKQKIRELLRDKTGFEPGLEFVAAPELICGVEIASRELRVAWSIADYLDSLREDLSRIMDQKTEQVSGASGGIEDEESRTR
ncbi:hypothetical protein [Methanothrix sp.]|uniref:F0F1 ATP synthase subunit B family protein n=1 Tax=Methanothrix sp. TaxID=90426 RepID=UPI003C78CA06